MRSSRWSACFDDRPQAQVRLICVPHAGAGASTYRSWHRDLPDWIEVIALKLPGREDRLREPTPDSMEELACDVLDGLDELLAEPHAWFGHSAGALLAFELARVQQSEGRPTPQHLFVSGHGAPDGTPSSLLHLLDDEALAAELDRLGGLPAVVRERPELFALYARIVRSDVARCARYAREPHECVGSPVSAFAGASDPYGRPDHLRSWAERTTESFRLRVLPGNHFFPTTARRELLAAVADDLVPASIPVPAG